MRYIILALLISYAFYNAMSAKSKRGYIVKLMKWGIVPGGRYNLSITTEEKPYTNPNNPAVITVDIYLNDELKKIYVNAAVQVSSKGCNFCHTIVNRTIDGCGILNETIGSWSRRFYDEIVKVGNFPTECPVHKGHYFIHNLKIVGSSLPYYMPEGSVKIMINVATDEKMKHLVFESNFTGSIVSRKV